MLQVSNQAIQAQLKDYVEWKRKRKKSVFEDHIKIYPFSAMWAKEQLKSFIAKRLSAIFDLFKVRAPSYSIQLTNWILWNGKFYYRDVIKMTITRAKGEGNGHFYHIAVIDLPFHTIPFVSCFISLIENTKNELLLKIYKQIWDNLRASKFTGQSIFSFAHYALCARTMTMEDAYQVKITLQSRAPNVDSNSLTYFWFYCTAHAALCATHIGFMCIMTQNGRLTHGPWNSWWNYFMIMKWYGMSNIQVYGTILVWVIYM